MTDKQIMIDGVDVSGCEWFYKNDPCKNTCKYFCTKCEWVEIQNCMYKYAKRKEQECEELAYENYELNELFDRLKAENEKLEEQLELNTANAVVIDMAQRLYKLKQTLTEIKEIAERGFKHSQCNCGAKADLDLILQKISEVEDANI